MDNDTPPESPSDVAMDILTAAGLPLDHAAGYVMYAAVAGIDPVTWARHFVNLRVAVSGGRA